MQSEIIKLILEERKRQDDKWGANRNLLSTKWLSILIEEIGEVAKAMLEGDSENMKKELIQSAAVIVAWLEDLFSR